MSFHRFATWIAGCFASVITLGVVPVAAQNLLVDGDFEAAVQPQVGDNILAVPHHWVSTMYPLSGSNTHLVDYSVVHIDGPNGALPMAASSMNGGDPVLQALPRLDASGSASGQYLRLNMGTNQGHYIGQRLEATQDGCIEFSASIATAHPMGLVTSLSVSSLDPAVFATIATPPTLNERSVHYATNGMIAMEFFNQPNVSDDWTSVSVHFPAVAGTPYALSLNAVDRHAIDNVSARYVSAQHCDPNWTPPAITPQDVSLTKTCQPPVAHTHNGILGQKWTCQVDVASTLTPFAGDLIVHDIFTNTPLVNGQILLGQSVSGNGSCFQGDCLISGANFDGSGSESFTYDVFVEAVGEADVYPLENCITGEIDDGSGTMQPLSPNCTTGQWIPRSEVVKSCDPIPAGTSAPYTMNCQIDVTASGLVGGTFVSVMDAFAAMPPSIATVTPTFMNVTSTENWDCIDHALNQPSSIGICELPAEDLMAAGGSSTLDISFQFDIDQGPTQVANCRFADIHSGSYLGKLSGQRGAVRSPIQSGTAQNASWPQMPDGCVYVDVPAEAIVTGDTPEFDVAKDCKPIGERMVFGATGWFQPWACTITVTSNGVPFNDPLWLDEDMFYGANSGSQSISSITSNDPWQCTPAPYGAGGNQPACVIQGSQFPHNTSTLLVTLNLFGGAADEFGAENCVALTMGKEPSDNPDEILAEGCTTIIDAPDPKAPQIDLLKTCEPAVQSGNGQWTVQCTLTITGQNLPAGQQLRVTDELMSSSTQSAVFGVMNAHTNSCGGGPITGGTMAGCDLNTDDINAAGGTLIIPYTGTYHGPGGRPIDGPNAQNCAFVDVPSLGLHGPQSAQGGNGKSCVPIAFKLQATGGVSDVIFDPVKPDVGGTSGGIEGTGVTGPALDATAGDVTIVLPDQTPSITKTCDPLVFAPGEDTAPAQCTITIVAPAGLGAVPIPFTDTYSFVGQAAMPGDNLIFGPLTNFSGAAGLVCNTATSNPHNALYAQCHGPAFDALSNGGTLVLHWNGQIRRPRAGEGPFRNCASFQYLPTPTSTATSAQDVHACHIFEVTEQKSTPRSPKPTPQPILEPMLKIRKQQTSDCVPNRDTQRYSCGFRITVTNEGRAPFSGPLVVTDTFGSPWAQAITQTSGGGWACAQPVGGAVSCENSGLNLAQGSFSFIDLDMQVQGLVNGGTWENCAAAGIPDDRTQRVAAIQQVMNARGLKAGPVDGRSGTKTYRALAQLQKTLGLPVSREFDDALFAALGLPLAKPGEKACVVADLPPMPKPPLQCERGTTVKDDETCQCRYSNMVRRNATACQCKRGYVFVAGKGCAEQVVAPPKPVPAELVCDKRSTRARGGQCVCLDPKNAVKTSSSTCRCKNGLPMVGGKCLSISVTPGKDTHDSPVGTEGNDKCRLRVNGICIK